MTINFVITIFIWSPLPKSESRFLSHRCFEVVLFYNCFITFIAQMTVMDVVSLESCVCQTANGKLLEG